MKSGRQQEAPTEPGCFPEVSASHELTKFMTWHGMEEWVARLHAWHVWTEPWTYMSTCNTMFICVCTPLHIHWLCKCMWMHMHVHICIYVYIDIYSFIREHTCEMHTPVPTQTDTAVLMGVQLSSPILKGRAAGVQIAFYALPGNPPSLELPAPNMSVHSC